MVAGSVDGGPVVGTVPSDPVASVVVDAVVGADASTVVGAGSATSSSAVQAANAKSVTNVRRPAECVLTGAVGGRRGTGRPSRTRTVPVTRVS